MTVSKNQKAAVAVLSNEEVKTGLFGKIFTKATEPIPPVWVVDVQEDVNDIEEYHNPMLGIDVTYFDKD